MNGSIPGESGLSRMVRLLEAFDARQPTMSPAELSRRTKLPIATTYRMVNEMVSLRLLDRSEDGVQTGVRLWELASRGSKTLRLRNTALPFMEDLQQAIQQHTQLAILEGTEILYLERLSASGAVVNITRVAGRLPAIVCSPGLILTAYATPTVQKTILDTAPPRYTSLTPSSTAGFPRILAEVRQQGFARVDGWINEGVSGVSVPVRGQRGEVIAALAVLLPNDDKTPRTVLPALQIAASGISRALGWSPKRRTRN